MRRRQYLLGLSTEFTDLRHLSVSSNNATIQASKGGPRRMARRPTRRLGAAAVSLLTFASTVACGTYVSRARIEAAAGMRNARTGQDLSAGSQDGSGTGSGAGSNSVAGSSGAS